jgi:hypothetical protein
MDWLTQGTIRRATAGSVALSLAMAFPASSAPAAAAAPKAVAAMSGVEDCVVVDPLKVKTDSAGGDWQVTLAANASLDFGTDATAAARAVEVIQHYHFTRQCFVKRPYAAMMYWRNGVAVPPGNMPDQDCIALHPENVMAVYAAGRWKVMDGTLWLLDFYGDQSAAEEAVRVIRTYSLNRECFVARPHVVMQYWLAE